MSLDDVKKMVGNPANSVIPTTSSATEISGKELGVLGRAGQMRTGTPTGGGPTPPPNRTTPQNTIQSLLDPNRSQGGYIPVGTPGGGRGAGGYSTVLGTAGYSGGADSGRGNFYHEPPASAPGSGTDAQNDAYATLKGFLDQYGLGELADWAWQQLLLGHSPDQIMLDLYDQPAFKARFPAIDARQKAGLPPISPAEYIAYESSAAQIMRAAGFPPGFYDSPDDFTAFIAGNVSIAEVSQRASLYQQAAFDVPAEDRAALRDLYGVDEGGIAAYFADPTRALPLLQQQEQAAAIAGSAQRQHFGPLTRSEAERLASLGVTGDEAAQGFGQVYQAGELFQQLPGEVDTAPGRSTALGLVAGDAASITELDRQAAKRKAQFQGGGGYAQGKTGTTGLGSAAT